MVNVAVGVDEREDLCAAFSFCSTYLHRKVWVFEILMHFCDYFIVPLLPSLPNDARKNENYHTIYRNEVKEHNFLIFKSLGSFLSFYGFIYLKEEKFLKGQNCL